MFLLWACRYIWQVKDTMKANNTGISMREIVPATSAIFSSWPKATKIGVVKKNRGKRRIAQMVKTIHDLWRYIPSMWYCFAPKACPQSVSNALAMPNCTFKFRYQNKRKLKQLFIDLENYIPCEQMTPCIITHLLIEAREWLESIETH